MGQEPLFKHVYINVWIVLAACVVEVFKTVACKSLVEESKSHIKRQLKKFVEKISSYLMKIYKLKS